MKHILAIAAILLTTTAHAYTPLRPCHYCDRPIPPTTSGRFHNDRSEHQAMKGNGNRRNRAGSYRDTD